MLPNRLEETAFPHLNNLFSLSPRNPDSDLKLNIPLSKKLIVQTLVLSPTLYGERDHSVLYDYGPI